MINSHAKVITIPSISYFFKMSFPIFAKANVSEVPKMRDNAVIKLTSPKPKAVAILPTTITANVVFAKS